MGSSNSIIRKKKTKMKNSSVETCVNELQTRLLGKT